MKSYLLFKFECVEINEAFAVIALIGLSQLCFSEDTTCFLPCQLRVVSCNEKVLGYRTPGSLIDRPDGQRFD